MEGETGLGETVKVSVESEVVSMVGEVVMVVVVVVVVLGGAVEVEVEAEVVDVEVEVVLGGAGEVVVVLGGAIEVVVVLGGAGEVSRLLGMETQSICLLFLSPGRSKVIMSSFGGGPQFCEIHGVTASARVAALGVEGENTTVDVKPEATTMTLK